MAMHHKVLVEAWALPFLEGSRCHADVDQHTHKACKEENKLVELIQLNGAWMEGGTSTTPCLCMFFCRVFSFFSFFFFLSVKCWPILLKSHQFWQWVWLCFPSFLHQYMDSPYRCMNGALLHAYSLWFSEAAALVLANIMSVGPHSYVTIRLE